MPRSNVEHDLVLLLGHGVGRLDMVHDALLGPLDPVSAQVAGPLAGLYVSCWKPTHLKVLRQLRAQGFSRKFGHPHVSMIKGSVILTTKVVYFSIRGWIHSPLVSIHPLKSQKASLNG